MKTKYFECQCDSSDHTIRFVIDKLENEVYLEIQLCKHKNIFQRAWSAIKYILGYECKYGHWDCVLLKNEDRKEIIKILE
jgi:hypothetical protein